MREFHDGQCGVESFLEGDLDGGVERAVAIVGKIGHGRFPSLGEGDDAAGLLGDADHLTAQVLDGDARGDVEHRVEEVDIGVVDEFLNEAPLSSGIRRSPQFTTAYFEDIAVLVDLDDLPLLAAIVAVDNLDFVANCELPVAH